MDDPQAISGDVGNNYQVSPDGQFGVYTADDVTDKVVELYSVEFSTGTVTKLNPSLVVGGDVQDFRIAPDSSRVVYMADQVTTTQSSCSARQSPVAALPSLTACSSPEAM